MRLFRLLRDRIRGVSPDRRERTTAEISEELRHHIQLATDENIRRGMMPDDARADATRRVGNLPLLQDRGYDVRGGGLVEAIVRDVRFALRLMLRQPAFSTIALATIAVGIGATTTIVGVANGVLLKPLPYPEPDRLVMVWMDNARIPLREDWHSFTNIEDYRRANRTFEAIAVFNNRSQNLIGAGDADRVTGAHASANFFAVLGVSAARGRVFTDAEDAPGKDRVVVLSHGLWMHRFGGDPNMVGRTINLSGVTREVIGVMPEGFAFPRPVTDFWVPTAPAEQLRQSRNSLWLQSIGRLKPGVTVAVDPDQPLYGVATVDDLLRDLTASLLAAAGIYGVISYSVEQRTRELGVRLALGARRREVFAIVLKEGMMLAGLGVVVGLAAAFALTRWMRALLYDTSASDPATFAAMAAGAVVVAAIACVVPAARATRVDPMVALRAE